MPTGMIIAIAAAAVLIIISVIICSIIVKKKRRSAAVNPERSIFLKSNVPESAAETGFRLLESTVIIHTNEKM